MKLNPHDGYNYLRYGMCLDWLEKHDEAGPYFNRADALDPNGYYTAANIGWHYVQTGNYAAARPWLERSLRLNGTETPWPASTWTWLSANWSKTPPAGTFCPPVFERKWQGIPG